jgi:hypothetical protein
MIRHLQSPPVMAALEGAIQLARVGAPEEFSGLLDGRVEPGHDEWEFCGERQGP